MPRRLAVNHQPDRIGQLLRHTGNDAAPQELGHGAALRRADDEVIDARAWRRDRGWSRLRLRSPRKPVVPGCRVPRQLHRQRHDGVRGRDRPAIWRVRDSSARRRNKPKSLSRRGRKGWLCADALPPAQSASAGVIPRAATMIFCPSASRDSIDATRSGTTISATCARDGHGFKAGELCANRPAADSRRRARRPRRRAPPVWFSRWSVRPRPGSETSAP